MDAIQEGQDENSLSGIVPLSLNNIFSQEEEFISSPDDATTSTSDENNVFDTENNAGSVAEIRKDGVHSAVQHSSNNHYLESDDDDGYPTDEQSLVQMKEKEIKRRSILQLARSRLGKKITDGSRPDDKPEQNTPDDSSFLANVDVADVESSCPDDSTFLVKADVEDVPVEDVKSLHDDGFAENRGGGNDADSYYDVHASTLSRASASTKASIGDIILKESNVAAQMTRNQRANNANDTTNGNTGADNQSASTYSYRRAYVDNVTLGSNNTSAYSTLTDEYCFDARKTGMSTAVMGNEGHDVKHSNSGPVDADTGVMMIAPSDKSHEESLARPPPPSSSNQSSNSTEYEYENPEHLTRVVSFGGGGGGEGYVDEEAARKFSSSNGSGCCGWFTSSSRLIKVIVLCSAFLMLISVVGVAFSLLLPEEGGDARTESSARSSGLPTAPIIPTVDADERVYGGGDDASKQNDVGTTFVPTTGSPTPAPSASPKESSIFPTQAPSKAPESFIFTTSEVQSGAASDPPTPSPSSNMPTETKNFTANPTTNPPTKHPSMTPTLKPTVDPTRQPTWKPSDGPTGTPSKSPTNAPLLSVSTRPTGTPSKSSTNAPLLSVSTQPTGTPSKSPTNEPTTAGPTVQPTPIPTEFPITISAAPTELPTSPPTLRVPAPTQASSQTVTLRSTQDTYVNQTSPYKNYGGYDYLRVDASPRVWSFVEFDTTSVMEGTAQTHRQAQPASQNEPRKMQAIQEVLNAKLRLYTLDEGGGGIFFALPNAGQWSERGLRWKTMGRVDTSGQVRVGSNNWFDAFRWYEMDVTDAFQGDAGPNIIRSFLIKSYSTNGVDFASREYRSGKFSPELVLTLSTSPNTPESASPTVHPTNSSLRPTDKPTRQPTQQPSNGPTTRPSIAPTYQPSTASPTKSPTSKPTKRPTPNPSRAPHKRPKRPTRNPTRSPSPTYGQIDSLAANKSVSFPNFVPPGCPATSDINFALKEATIAKESIPSVHVVFPSQDSYIGEGENADENYGSSDALILEHYTSRVLVDFDIGSVAFTRSAYIFASVSLRLFVDSVGGTRSISIYKLPQSSEWAEDLVTLNNFGTPPIEKAGPTFQTSSSNVGKWIDVDITDLIDGSQANIKLILVMKDFSESDDTGKCVFASRETCHSPKLVVVT